MCSACTLPILLRAHPNAFIKRCHQLIIPLIYKSHSCHPLRGNLRIQQVGSRLVLSIRGQNATRLKIFFYKEGLASCWPSPSASPTLSAVVCPSAPAVSSSPPCWRMLYSCSMAVSCWSSAKDRAKGTPKKRAEVVMTQVALPLKEMAVQAALETVLALAEIQPRVVGGMMSRRAYRRSVKVSSRGS